MWLTQLAVRRPITTLMACVIVVLLGITALLNLSVDLMPNLQFPTVSVTTLYSGAGPEEVETLITRPLEQTLSSVNGFERLTSESYEGSSSIRVQFQWGTNLDTAMADMRQAIDRVRDDMPDDIEAPLLRRYDINDSPVIYMGVQSDAELVTLTRMIERDIIPRLERLDGVARVGMRGEVRREIQVNLDRSKLESLSMGVNEVVTALEEGNVNQPAGDYDEGTLQRLLRSRTEFESLDDIRDLVVRRQADAVVRVRDIADVVDGNEEVTQLTRIDGRPGIMIYIFQQSGSNTIDVSDEIQATMEDLNAELRDAKLVIRLDKSRFIRDAVSSMRQAAIYGMLLAMAVLIVFLRSFRSTLVIAVSIPLSVLATCVLIYFCGFTLNMVSFGGLVLGLGMLVDNSIVVLESIFRKRDDGLNPRHAAVEGTREVSSAITASTLTTLIVFLPLLFVEGMTGILVHQLAYVVTFSLVCSLIASVTLTPALAAHWMKDHGSHATGLRRWTDRLHAGSRAALGLVEQSYGWLLRKALGAPGVVTFTLLLTLSITVGLLPRVGSEFLPQPDDGRLGVNGEMAPSIQLETLDRQSQIVEDALFATVPEAESISVFVGDEADDGEDWHKCRFSVQLAPRSQRDETVQAVRERLDAALPPVAGMTVKTRVYSGLPLFRMFGSNEGESLAVLIRGHDRETSEQLSTAVAEVMERVPGIVTVEQEQNERRPEIATIVDRQKASLLGIRASDITQALATTIRGTPATVFREDGDEFNVMVRLRESDRQRQADIGQVGVATPEGNIIPLRNLVSFAPDEAPLTIQRVDRQRVAIVTASVENRDLGSVVADLRQRFASLAIPEGFTVDISGDWEEQQKSFNALRNGFLLAVVLMYVIMAAQFESLRDPLMILLTLPLAAIGVVAVMVFGNTTLNAQSFIGIVVLAGIVVNNAIVLVDYINQLRLAEPGTPVHELIVRAAVRRLRPILMTTLTTVLGMWPIAIGAGDGGELQAPLARVIVAGLITGTLITLLAIPVVYLLATGDGEETARQRENEALVTA